MYHFISFNHNTIFFLCDNCVYTSIHVRTFFWGNKCFLVVSAWCMASQRWRFKIVCSQCHRVFGAYVLTQFAKHFIFLRLVGNPGEERAWNFRNSTGVSLVLSLLPVVAISSVESWFDSSVCPRKHVIFLWFSTGDFSLVFFVAAACLCISDKLCDIQSIVRKTWDRISVHYLSPEWRSLDRIAKFASTIPTTGAQYANSMGRMLTFCAEREFGCTIFVFNATMAQWRGPKWSLKYYICFQVIQIEIKYCICF